MVSKIKGIFRVFSKKNLKVFPIKCPDAGHFFYSIPIIHIISNLFNFIRCHGKGDGGGIYIWGWVFWQEYAGVHTRMGKRGAVWGDRPSGMQRNGAV